MEKSFAVYKGLQKPLVYRGFSGKFIYWGIASLLSGLVLGALVMALFSMLLGVLVLAACIGGGLAYTLSRQKQGLFVKSRAQGIYHFQTKINPKIYEGSQRIQDALYRH
nr:plasmid transfer protein [Pedobacter panaciterrae]